MTEGGYCFKSVRIALKFLSSEQSAKKIVSVSPGLVDFAVGLVTSVVKMTLGLVHVSYNLSKWQAVKLTFFAPFLSMWLLLLNANCLIELIYCYSNYREMPLAKVGLA